MRYQPQSTPYEDAEFDPAFDAASDDFIYDEIAPLDFADDHQTRLGLALDFSPYDLAANRQGWLTDSQIERLESDLDRFYWPIIITLAILAFMIGAGSAVAGTITAIPFVLLGLAAVPALLLKYERERLPVRPVKASRLRMGWFGLIIRRLNVFDDGRTIFGEKYAELPVEGRTLVLGPRRLYKILQPNQLYIAYYVPARVRPWRGYRLLSLEPVDIEKEKHSPKRKAKRKRS